ncbi:HIRA-interacting protein 3 [Mactra antiquata]
MENYINEILIKADLSVLTKKHVRMKYKQHVGRELTSEEKNEINDMVYAFVKELSALEKEKDSPIPPEPSPQDKNDSPGNKENENNKKSSKIIIKGQVVDRSNLYKKKESKPSEDKSKTAKLEKSDKVKKSSPDKQEKIDKVKKSSPDKPEQITPKSPYARAVKMRINDVMSAVLGDADSSSEVSSVSSLSDTSLSEDEDNNRVDKDNMSEALQKLKEARDKKIQMSAEKKQKLKTDKTHSKVRRSLPMKNDRVENLKKESVNDSDTIKLISDFSAEENNKKEERLGIPTHKEKSSVKNQEKVKKLVKRKVKTVDSNSDSDDDSEAEAKLKHNKTKSNSKTSKLSYKLDTDSDKSTGDTPLIKKKRKKVTECSSVEKKKANRVKSESDSELSTGDTPLAKKKVTLKKSSVESDSESSSGDTPLAKKKISLKKKSVGSDSDDSTGDTPLSKKKVNKTKNNKSTSDQKKVKSKKYVTEVRKTYPKRSGKNDSISSESSSGDIPLAQLKKNSEADISVSAAQNMPETDDEVNSDDDMGEKIERNDTNGSESVKVETKSDSLTSKKRKLSKGSDELDKQEKKRQKLNSNHENGMNHELSDSELSDLSTDDTPLVKKRDKLRKNATKSQILSQTKSDAQSNSNTQDNNVDNGVGDTVGNSELDNNDGFDSPLKIKKSKTKAAKIDSDSDDDDLIIVKEKIVKKSKKKADQEEITEDSSDIEESVEENTEEDTVEDDDVIDSDDSDDAPLSSFRSKAKTYDLSSDSEDDIPLSNMAGTSRKQKKTQKKIKDTDEENLPERTYIRLLKQICRECQMFVRSDRELAGCDTDQQKIDKLEQMLRDVGMKGKPSMKKAEEVKLQKEAKELSADNIISSETGRVMRKVRSIYARRTISPVKPVKSPMKNPFTGLQDIVDSEGTESTE